jgi:hypothetical protein
MKTIVALIALFPLVILAESGVMLGYVTGNDYLELDDNYRMGWLIGAMDGIIAESVITEKDADGPWLGRCVAKLSLGQIKAMFEKESRDNPEGWHAPAAIVLRSKMQDFCKGR